jgi:hypothetical protein
MQASNQDLRLTAGDLNKFTLFDLPDDVVQECERTALDLANRWADASDGARTCILTALLRVHAGYRIDSLSYTRAANV